MLLLQALQGFQRLVYPVQASLVGGDQVQERRGFGALQPPALPPRRALRSGGPLAELTDVTTSSSIREDPDGLCIAPDYKYGSCMALCKRIQKRFIGNSSWRHRLRQYCRSLMAGCDAIVR